jgi:hypothetical protein
VFPRRFSRAKSAIGLVVGSLLWHHTSHAQMPSAPNSPAELPLNDQRILGVIPDYQTVRDPSRNVAPMTAKQKWRLVWKESVDPFNIATSAFSAALSQADGETPKYGRGGVAYAKRFGAAIADLGTQEMFSDGVLACLLHQDPRYFRRGPSSKFPARVAYSLSRIVIARQDSGRDAFNAFGVFGMMLGIGASNAYYPSASRTGSVMIGRIGTSLLGGVVGNLMSEFWPDVQRRFLRKKSKNG